MNAKPVKIEGDLLKYHYHLSKDDRCFFFCAYYPGQGYLCSECNSLIFNFKKSPARKEKVDYPYKNQAIEQIARKLEQSFTEKIVETCTFVPIPPSKAKSHQDYDDRCSQVLKIVQKSKGIDFRELLSFTTSHPAYHASPESGSPEELKGMLQIENCLIPPLKETVVLFDDVVNRGTHFKACKDTLVAKFPNISVAGLFVARAAGDVVKNN